MTMGNPVLGNAYDIKSKVFAHLGSEIKLLMVASEKECYRYCEDLNWTLEDSFGTWLLCIQDN